MTINKQKISAVVLVGLVVGLPLVVAAAAHPGSLVPCVNDCDFNKLMEMANRIINFLLYAVLVPLTALVIMYVGARLVLFPDKESEKTKAKESFLLIAQGVFIVLGAFVLIKFVLFEFLSPEYATFARFLIN